MPTKEFSCAAQKSLHEIKARQQQQAKSLQAQYNPPSFSGTSGSQTAPFYAPSQPQNISGVIVPPKSPQHSNFQFSPEQAQEKGSASNRPDLSPNKTHQVYFSQGPQAAQAMENAQTSKMRVSKSGLLYTLHMIREPVVDYQEARGVPRNEEVTFVTLVTSLCTQAYTAAITILVMLWNLMPLVDGLVYFLRFFLDKVIDIVETEDNKDRAIKGAILFGELTVILFLIFLIVGLILMPVYQLMARLFSKVFSMVAW
ncbi:uncharacterized protein LOC115884050 isoform X2 [Sitophilus oryzae]|uniref:Uncharacterized protein LOC115884050 isoform X2 n=1 Tax=Sitophilus oryzae TaxID=7048 RepID=A0A6J2Y526_SITOR|nr:uncharacterized protein LOC115884050 isoform X2 [Sitophilus oryzae]